jgi:tetratricopeptide (TPR) repeat protein
MELSVYPDYTFRLGSVHSRIAWQRPTTPRLGAAATDRHALNAVIRAALARTGSCVLCGVPGTGKSTLAARYGITAGEDYPGGVILVRIGPHSTDGTSQWVLREWFVRATELTETPAGLHIHPSHVQTLWEHAPRMLVILDDVIEPAHIDTLRMALPAHAHMIVTTRSDACATGLQMQHVQVDAYSLPDALAAMAQVLVQPHTTLVQWQWPAALARHLQLYPLAIDQACQYLVHLTDNPAGWASEAEELCAQDMDSIFPMLLHRPIALGEQQSSLIERGYQRLHPLDRQLLLSLACCALDVDIPLRLLCTAWSLDGDTITQMMTRLEDHGLVVRTSDTLWRQHAVLRACVRNQLVHPDAEELLMRRILMAVTAQMARATHDYQYGQAGPVYQQMAGLFDSALALDVAIALDLVTTCAPYHAGMGMHDEQLAWARRVADTCASSSDVEQGVWSQMLVADACVALAAHVGIDRGRHLRAAVAHYHAARMSDASIALHPQRAALFNRRAICMIEMADLPEVDREALLTDAVASCTEALRDPQLDAALYAAVSQNKANVLHELSMYAYPAGTETLDEAIASCHGALQYLPTQLTTQHFIGLHATLASLYRTYAEREGVDRASLLQRARDASSTVLLHLDATSDPMRYAKELMNRANIFCDLAEQCDVDQLHCIDEAIDGLHEALTYRTEDIVPLEYAWTQHNLALAYRIKAHLEGQERITLLRAAITAMEEALRYRTRSEVPSHASLSHYMLATICRDVADSHALGDPAREAALVAGLAQIDVAQDIYGTLEKTFEVSACHDVRAGLLWRRALLPSAGRDHFLAQATNEVALALAGFDPDQEPNDSGECLLTAACIAAWTPGQQHRAEESALRAVRMITLDHNAELYCRARLVLGDVLVQRVLEADDATVLVQQGMTALDIAQRLGHGPHELRAYGMLQAAADVLGATAFGRLWNAQSALPVPIVLRLRALPDR